MGTYHRLLAGLLLAASCVLLAPAGSSAGAPSAPCACQAAGGSSTGMVQDHVREASAVFTGTVEAITPASSAGTPTSRTSTVSVELVYKPREGLITTPTVDVVTTRSFGNCTSELVQGEQYVFFVESDEGFTATGCGGTSVASAQLVTQVQNLLGEGRPPVPPEPPTAQFTPVNTDEPASLTRVAAPGVALVLIGLLGLAVVRRLARPRP